MAEVKDEPRSSVRESSTSSPSPSPRDYDEEKLPAAAAAASLHADRDVDANAAAAFASLPEKYVGTEADRRDMTVLGRTQVLKV